MEAKQLGRCLLCGRHLKGNDREFGPVCEKKVKMGWAKDPRLENLDSEQQTIPVRNVNITIKAFDADNVKKALNTEDVKRVLSTKKGKE